MAKQLLVKTPQTVNGIDLAYDEHNKPRVKETIVPLTAKKSFESLNNSLPEHLRHKFETVDVDSKGNIITPKAETKADAGKK